MNIKVQYITTQYMSGDAKSTIYTVLCKKKANNILSKPFLKMLHTLTY